MSATGLWEGRCRDCGSPIAAEDFERVARSDVDLPAHAIVEGEALCGCRVEHHAGLRDGPLWWRVWAHFRYGWRGALVLVRCRQHGGGRVRMLNPWRDERDARDGTVGGHVA